MTSERRQIELLLNDLVAIAVNYAMNGKTWEEVQAYKKEIIDRILEQQRDR